MSDRRALMPVFILLWGLLAGSGFLRAAEIEQHTVPVDGHPFAVWSKTPAHPRAVMLLIHGRTWSTRPDFDLQVAGESLSLMDGLVERGIAAYGIDLRGYGATPRDASGWATPDRSAEDVAGVLKWIRARHGQLNAPLLFGWSNGALVAQLAVQRLGGDQNRWVSGLILFGYPLRPEFFDLVDGDSSEGNSAESNSAEDESSEADSTEFEAPLRAKTTARAAASDFLLPGTISQRAIEVFVASALNHDPVRMDWHELGQWRSLNGAEIQTPTLLMQAEHDPLAITAAHNTLFSTLATADKVWAVIPGGDHAAFMETPRPYFLELINGFIFRGQTESER